MLKFLSTATKVAGLTYQLATTIVLIGALAAGVVTHLRQHKRVG